MKNQFWHEINDQQAEIVSGGERNWPVVLGQQIPPGFYQNLIENGKVPPGLLSELDANGVDVPLHGKKNGFATNPNVGAIPRGWVP